MIVVTTPTGNVGSEVVRLLMEQSPRPELRIAAHNPEKIQQIYGSEAVSVKFDFGDASTWEAVLDGIEILFLVCPQPDPKTIRTQTLPFIDAAIKAGCQHIIYMSVPGADRAKIIPHYQIERHIEASEIVYTLLRPAYFMQNFIRKVPTHGVDIATQHEIFIPAGGGAISLIDAHDVAQVVVKICADPQAHKNQAYKLTGTKSLTFYEIAAIFAQVMKEPIRYTHPSLPHFWYRLRKRKVAWSLLLIMSIEYSLAAWGKSGGTSDTLEQILARKPTTLAQFISANRQRWINQTWV